MPMAPDPAISSERGSAGGSMASKYVQMLLPSGSMPGSDARPRAGGDDDMRGRVAARRPCASFGGSGFCRPLDAGAATSIAPPPRNVAVPQMTSTPFFLRRKPTPVLSSRATSRERSSMTLRSSVGAPGTTTPKLAASPTSWKISAERSSALVGMQPQLRQMPPRCACSTTAVRRPSCAARMAAT